MSGNISFALQPGLSPDILLLAGSLLLIAGCWLRCQFVRVRMALEEDVKNRKLTDEAAGRRMRVCSAACAGLLLLGAGMLAVALAGLLRVS
jgi:hypothetical protein